jgi:Ca2+-transporting ATPase
MVGGQIMIVFVGGAAFSITALDGPQWAISLLVAVPCLLWGVLVRCFPDAWFAVVFNGALAGLTFVLRPMWRVLHVVFHPVAQFFRATSRFTKRVVRKMTGKKAAEQDEEPPVDEERPSSIALTEKRPTTVDEATRVPSSLTPVPTEQIHVTEKGKARDDNEDDDTAAERKDVPVPSFSITGPT